MPSVADRLRQAQRQRMAALSADDRIEIAFQLGDADVELYCATAHVSAAAARERLGRARRIGRRPSRAMERDAP